LLVQSLLELERDSCQQTVACRRRRLHTLASLSAARLAYMLGCRLTLLMLVACGRAWSDEERLGRETRWEGAREAIAVDSGETGATEVYEL
jgi:hypothetical protein